MEDLEREPLQVFRTRRWFPRPVAMERGHVRFVDSDLVLLRGDVLGDRMVGEVELVRLPLQELHYWQPPRWRSNAVYLRLEGGKETWAVMTARNGLGRLGYAQGWADGFAAELHDRGARQRS